ncbi:TPA: porin, partial [Escherichia coli]|nr:porin [Escherichia coli]
EHKTLSVSWSHYPAFVDYKINQLDSDNKLNINNDDIVAVGMTYQF